VSNERSLPAIKVSIAAVERDTGLSKDTLRVWERRYGFPNPARDAMGERSYSLEDVDKLRLIKRLMDQGHRPGKLIGQSMAQLQQLAEHAAANSNRGGDIGEPAEDLQVYLDLVKGHRIEELRRQLGQSVLRLGLARFVIEVVSPLNERVGDAWTRGAIEIFEEHLYTESIQVVLRNAINTIPRPGSRPPVVLLTTFPQEPHGIGLLMAESIFALEGCRCISLGVQTPIWDIVRAASVQHVDIVALSFSSCMNPNATLDGLVELRSKLPADAEIWAGGSCPILQRRPLERVRTLRYLSDISTAMAEWRAARRTEAAANS
jgi:DNA-binding transcriptional MerR regulator/methylmalonyl-CoA mutase cobalamin-binding subunit